MTNTTPFNKLISQRFRGYLPVVIDIETAGFNAKTDAILEIAASIIYIDNEGMLHADKCNAFHVEPFEGANLDPKALAFTGIDPFHPFREAVSETVMLKELLGPIRTAVKASGCKRAILVGHNAFFDLGFLNAAIERCNYKRSPFHQFSTFDTVSLAGLAYGQTVLAKAAIAAEIEWDGNEAHSAAYDTEKTAELFCKIMNNWHNFMPDKPWMKNSEEEN